MRGGTRPGSGRKRLPRHTPEATRAIVAEMQGGGTRVALAARLVVGPSAIRAVCQRGATEAQIVDWWGRLGRQPPVASWLRDAVESAEPWTPPPGMVVFDEPADPGVYEQMAKRLVKGDNL